MRREKETRILRTIGGAVEDGGQSDQIASGPALSLTRHFQRAVTVQQLLVEGPHVAAGEGLQRPPQQREAVGSL